MLADLRSIEGMVSGERIMPAEVAFRDPRDVYHQISIGAVFTSRNFSADDARRLDGFLALTPLQVLESDRMLDYWREGFERGRTIGDALSIFLDRAASFLEDRGRYEEWRRRYDAYLEKTGAFLNSCSDSALEAMLRRPPSRKQLWLVRYTCECLRLDVPELRNRRDAFLWLRDVGANPRYREAVA